MQRIYPILLLIFISCSNRHVSSSAPNELGVDLRFPSDADSSYKALMIHLTDSLLQMNNNSSLHLHQRTKTDTMFLVIDITKAKPATTKQIKNGFILSGIGLVGLPVSMLALNVGFVLSFYYFPQNKIDGRVYIQYHNENSVKAFKRLKIQTNALFTPKAEHLRRMQIKAQKKMAALFIHIQKKAPSKRGI